MNIHPSWSDLLSEEEISTLVRVLELTRDFPDTAPEDAYFDLEVVSCEAVESLLRVDGCTALLDKEQNALDTLDVDAKDVVCLHCAIGWAINRGVIGRLTNHPVLRFLRMTPVRCSTDNYQRRYSVLSFVYDMVFHGDWAEVNNTPQGVWMRGKWLLEDGIPGPFFSDYIAHRPVAGIMETMNSLTYLPAGRDKPLDIKAWLELGEIKPCQP